MNDEKYLIFVLKIITMAIFFACFCSKSNDENKEANEWLDDNCVDLNYDEQYLHKNEVCCF